MEIIDIFNDNHELIGTCEKKEAHEKGMWHEVFTCLFVNKEKNTVIFQIKRHEHNNIHSKNLIEITVGGHYKTGEKIEDGTREIEEETGLKVDFKDLISLGIRQVATTVNPKYIIREFQNIYLYPTNININGFDGFDTEEVADFIEFDINELIELLLDKRKSIIGITKKDRIEIDLDNFVESYLKGDKLYLRLLIAAKRYINGENTELIFW